MSPFAALAAEAGLTPAELRHVVRARMVKHLRAVGGVSYPDEIGLLACSWCGGAFRGREGQRYCSTSHRVLAYQRRRLAEREAVAA